MRPTILAIIALCIASHCFGAAPDRVDGQIYYEYDNSVGVGTARSSTTTALVLNSDGTFRGLFRNFVAPLFPISVSNPSLSALDDGTYTYRKIDDQTAELNLSFAIAGGGLKLRTLQFASASTGSIAGDGIWSITNSANFSFNPIASPAPLTNCSNRSFVRAGGTVFTGFVVPNGGAKVFIRAIGPTLSAFGLTNILRNPNLTVVRSANNSVVANNDDWSSQSAQAISRIATVVGAFPLPQGSQDSALIVTLAPGAYVAQVTSADVTDTGEVLIEVYLLP